MPLIKSGSKKAVSANIRAEMAAGKPQKQAIAIALDVARRSWRKADGGAVEDELLPPPRTPTQMPDAWNEAVRKVAKGVVDTVAAPGRAMQGKYAAKPEKPGLWSEEDEFRHQHAQRQQVEDAAAMSMDVAGARFPFAKAGEAGIFGGKLKQPGIKAYHASPHDFDRFDMSKIGTGEGGQSFGRGLYFAENEDVAKAYRDTFNLVNRTERVSALLEGRDVPPLMPEARMYEVNINANPDQFLDWDKRLGQQSPQVAEAMRGLSSRKRQPASDFLAATPDAEKRLLEAGIPGIKYLDQGSRTAGEGSRNYVVFNDKIIDILKKYGVTSVAALPPAVQASLGLLEEGQMKKNTGGTAMANARRYAAGGASRVPGPSFFQRDANRALSRQSGLIKSVVPGRTDKHNMRVASGSYIIPADVVSHLGQNNTLAGARFLKRKFGDGGGVLQFAGGGEVPMPVDIVTAGGEYVLSPDQVAAVGKGDLKKGHDTLDRMVLDTRKHHIKTLKNLAPPKRS